MANAESVLPDAFEKISLVTPFLWSRQSCLANLVFSLKLDRLPRELL